MDENIINLYEQGKWEDIVNLTPSDNKLSWVLPRPSDLKWISDIINEYQLSGMTSIGCGSGLFEWLLEQSSGLDVIGIELDKSWWRSKYSPPLFLNDIIFIDEKQVDNFVISSNRAILFCYFNNCQAFCNYMKNYQGNLVFVIGPCRGQMRSTDPMPFDEKFILLGWELLKSKEILHSKDCITVYTKL